MEDINPVDDIRATYGDELKGRKILLIVTGSISAYKIPDLIRSLIRHGADVYVLPSKEALRFITIDTLNWASGGNVIERFSYKAEHIYLLKKIDLVFVVPATANIIAKSSYGIADTDTSLALNSAFGYGKKIIYAPVMHLNMYRNPMIIEAIKRLKRLGAEFIEPKIEEEKAKLPDIDYLKMRVIYSLHEKPLKGYRILVTAGPTLEYIDPVRIITNKSSGKMGVYIAEAAYLMGGDVTLVAGRISVKPFKDIETKYVESTEEMYRVVLDELSRGIDIFISASAPVDYKPSRQYIEKLDTREFERLDLELILTPKIVSEARRRYPDIYIASFKALYNVDDSEMERKALEYMERYGFDMVIANDVSRSGVGFESDYNEILVIGRNGRKIFKKRDLKTRLARDILKAILNDISTG